MTTAYTIERFESRDWLMRLRYGWRIRAANGQIVLSSSQGHSRRIDREQVIANFFRDGVQGQSVGFAEEPTTAR